MSARLLGEFLGEFAGCGYFALDLHQAAAYVRASTLAARRVRKYAMQPHFSFFLSGQRPGAAVYVHDFGGPEARST
jgi:hypothetical protein